MNVGKIEFQKVLLPIQEELGIVRLEALVKKLALKVAALERTIRKLTTTTRKTNRIPN